MGITFDIRVELDEKDAFAGKRYPIGAKEPNVETINIDRSPVMNRISVDAEMRPLKAIEKVLSDMGFGS